MRRPYYFVVVALFLVVFAQEVMAFRPMREHKFDVSVSIAAGYPSMAVDDFCDGYLSLWERHFGTVESMYGDYMGDVKSSGLYSLRFEYMPLKWLSTGAEVSFMSLWAKTSHGFEDITTTKSCYVTYVMPQARFYYFRTRLSTLSSAVSAGVEVLSSYGVEGDARTKFGCQIYPISYTIGDKIYGRVELSVGTMVNVGLHFGVGVRF